MVKCKERYAAEKKWYSAADLHKLWNAQKRLGFPCYKKKRKRKDSQVSIEV